MTAIFSVRCLITDSRYKAVAMSVTRFRNGDQSSGCRRSDRTASTTGQRVELISSTVEERKISLNIGVPRILQQKRS